MDAPILFYSNYENPYGVFSNFSNHSVTIDGKKYPTTEHYFQAMKFADNPKYAEAIRKAGTPTICKRMGGSRKETGFDPDWEKNKINVMLVALRAKFTQHTDLKKILLDTGDRMLVEHTKIDKIWADGGDGGTGKIGKNLLGKCLMKVREELRKK